jgi:hypothetical protein
MEVLFSRFRKYCSAARLPKVWDMYPSMRRVCGTDKAGKRSGRKGMRTRVIPSLPECHTSLVMRKWVGEENDLALRAL